MEEDFNNYLRSNNAIGVFNYSEKSKVMINKIPYNSKIDILYSLDSYSGEFFDLNSPFKYAGFYDKENDKVYDLDYSIRWHILNWDYKNDKFEDKQDLYNLVSNDINNRVYELIQDGKKEAFNINNFDLLELTDKDVINEFMSGETSCSMKDRIRNYNSRKPQEILEYLTDRNEFIEEVSRDFIVDNAEDILNDMIESESKRQKLKEIEQDKNHIFYKIRDIVNCINNNNCKTVNLTIFKDNKEQTFIYDAKYLKNYSSSYLSEYNIIKLKDREEFEENFGRSADFYFYDIVKITYGKRTIYEDNNYLNKNKEEEKCL